MSHLSRCTASATTARTSRRLVRARTASATARDGKRLGARDHVKLLDKEPVEGIAVQPGSSGHGRMMGARSDKGLLHKAPISSQMCVFAAKIS